VGLGVIEALRVPDRLLPELRPPGTIVGPLLPGIRDQLPGGRAPSVVRVASHDTASAVVAAPLSGLDAAYISSGTWSLVGVELDAPVLDEAAVSFNFTNEAGFGGRTRFLRNVVGHGYSRSAGALGHDKEKGTDTRSSFAWPRRWSRSPVEHSSIRKPRQRLIRGHAVQDRESVCGIRAVRLP
jgi:sugar (pentulose or hexulose) kinase